MLWLYQVTYLNLKTDLYKDYVKPTGISINRGDKPKWFAIVLVTACMNYSGCRDVPLSGHT